MFRTLDDEEAVEMENMMLRGEYGVKLRIGLEGGEEVEDVGILRISIPYWKGQRTVTLCYQQLLLPSQTGYTVKRAVQSSSSPVSHRRPGDDHED